MKDVKPWYQSRTVGIAILQGIAGVMAAIFAVDPTIQTIGFIAVGKSVIDFMLRASTSKEIV